MTGQSRSQPDRAQWGRWFGRPGRSLTRRLIWLAAAWILIALAAAAVVLTAVFQESALRRLGNILGDTIDEAVVAATITPEGEVFIGEIQDARTQRLLSGKYWMVAEPTPTGGMQVLAHSASLGEAELEHGPDLTNRLRSAFGQTISYNAEDGPKGEPLRIAASMKQLPGRDRPVIFFAGIDRSDVDADTRQFATVTWIAMLLLGAGLVTAVFIQVQVGLRPLFDLGDEISDVRQGRSHRVEGAYPVEIQPLAEQVNRLLAHNQETVERQRTHVGNLAHALKTPLAVMLAEAGTKEGPLPDLIRRQTKVMQDQVDHHLRRARAAARAAHGLGERTTVAEVLDEMAVMLERVFETKGVEIDWRAPDDLAFLGRAVDAGPDDRRGRGRRPRPARRPARHGSETRRPHGRGHARHRFGPVDRRRTDPRLRRPRHPGRQRHGRPEGGAGAARGGGVMARKRGGPFAKGEPLGAKLRPRR